MSFGVRELRARPTWREDRRPRERVITCPRTLEGVPIQRKSVRHCAAHFEVRSLSLLNALRRLDAMRGGGYGAATLQLMLQQRCQRLFYLSSLSMPALLLGCAFDGA